MSFQQRLDSLLGYVTMYKLVVIGLLAISLTALVLMLVGYLPYSPVNFIAGVIAVTLASVASNKLFGYLFDVRPHMDSALITALILVLLFAPPETIIDGLKLAIVAVIAMASKYIINVRGKHVFNPAAIAVVIASITGFAYAGWWVASPALLPITAVVAFLVLYKTQKISMALIFLATAISIIATKIILSGDFSAQFLWLAITSWPLVFIAGIMLCEPLTLPPTKVQQWVLAAVVAVIVALPIHYGGFSTTPAVALVVGNVLALYVGTRRAVKMRFVSKKKESNDAYEFTFDVPKFAYYPGQYIELSLPHSGADFRGSRRVFTIVGQPGDDQLSIATRLPKRHSTFKDSLMDMDAGQTIWGLRVSGDFIMPKDNSIPLLCIAGGIGITPFVSFAMNSTERDITILYSVRTVGDIAFAKELSRYDVKVVIVTPDESKMPVNWKREVGSIDEELIEKYLKPEQHVYISGPPAMVTSVKRAVRSVGKNEVHTDHFSGY